MATVDLVSLSKSYGGVAVIHGIDLSIEEGQFVALVGPSGCGKSTLLRMIAGLEEATAGDIRLDGRRVNEATPKDRNVAMVFQNYALYPHMSVRDNVGLNLRIAGLRRTEVAERVSRVARLLDITDLLDRRPAQLSGGQRQRVAMGRAIVRDPAVFLFDEPLSNLDAKLRVQMRSEIKALHAKVRTTSIYVTHDQVEAMTLADRVVVLNKGRIEQEGSPLDLYRRPANLFVAGFIGSPAMNLLTATMVGEKGAPAARTSAGALLVLPSIAGARPGRSVLVGVRPEDMTAEPGAASLTGPIQLIEPVGAQTHVAIRHGEQVVWATVPGDSVPKLGQTLGLAVRPSLVHVFDAETGERLAAS